MVKIQKVRKRKSAQDIQDEIFRKMSVEKKIKLMSDWSAFCLKISRLDSKNGTRKTSQKNNSNSG